MSNILIQTEKQSLVFNKKNYVVAVSHYKNDVLINTYFLNVGFFRNIQKTMMHFRDALTRIKAYHDKDLFRLFPEMCPVNPPIVTTGNKSVSKSVGVVNSEGDALFNEHELTVINMVVNHRITLLKVSQKTDLYPQIYKVLLSVEQKTRFNNEQISYEQSLFNKECEL